MKLQSTHVAALALAGALAITVTSPSYARMHAAPVSAVNASVAYQGYAYDEAVPGHFAPGSTGYGRMAYNPEQPTDPDPRIGGALKMSTDR